MAPTNDFLPFCPTDTGSNLLSESDYTAAADRVSGNKPGVASAKLNNKALRQSAYIASQLAQFLANYTGLDVLDDATPAKLLAQMNASLLPIAPIVRQYLSGSGTHNANYLFMIASGNATAAATYTNNGITYTVVKTISSGLVLQATGSGAPLTSGTLTKASGSGDATLTFYAVRAALYIEVEMVGGGAGGSGGGTSAVSGTSGGDSTINSTLLIAGGGGAGSNNGGSGGAPTIASGPIGIGIGGGGAGAGGNGTGAGTYPMGGVGGSSAVGGSGAGGATGSGTAAATNSGSGGAGAGSPTQGHLGGGGGGSGAYIFARIFGPASTYTYAVGAKGTGGVGSESTGTDGAAGFITITEFFQ